MSAPTLPSARSPHRGWRALAAVLRAFWRVNVVGEMQYRANFVTSILGTLFWLAMALLTLAVFFHHTARLGGWDFWEVVVLLGVFNTLTGVIEAVLRPGIGQLAQQVRSGDLDLVLTKPVDAQFFVSFRELDLWRFADVVLGLLTTGYALVRLGRAPGAGAVLAFAVTMMAAVAVVYAIWVALMSLAFVFVAVENITILFDSVFEGARYPVSAYPGALRFLFVYVVPIAWTTTVPASTLVGRLAPLTALGAAGVGVVAIAVARLLWRAAIRRYTSAGG